MTEVPGVFVFGASGHATVIIDAIERAGLARVLFVCDDAREKRGTYLMGYPIVDREDLLARRGETRVGVVGIGDNAARLKVGQWLVESGCELVTVVHPFSSIGREVAIGAGTVVMAGCAVNSGTKLGRNVILNTGASVDHDCRIDDAVHIAPGAHLCGGVSVGAGTLIGAGSTVIPGVHVGAGVLIGAGSAVLKDVPDGARAAGNPCCLIA